MSLLRGRIALSRARESACRTFMYCLRALAARLLALHPARGALE
jgi:hypothetical protein